MGALCALLGVAPGLAGHAQVLRPADERPAVPAPAALADPVLSRLPPLPPSVYDLPAAPGAATLRVERFTIRGNTAISTAELERAVAPWTGRNLRAEEILAARDALTRLHAERGYVTSGAVLRDQDVRDGIVHVEIVEGSLEGIELEGPTRFRPGYLRSRLSRAAGAPVHAGRLETALRLLQEDPRIGRVRARLRPATSRGSSVLEVSITELPPLRLALRAANDRAPSVGGIRGELHAGHLNLTGRGDRLSVAVGTTEGLGEYDARYSIPLGDRDTLLELRARHSRSEVVEEGAFDGLDIESRSTTYAIGLSHPLIRTPSTELWLGLRGEKRRSRTFLEDEPFSFSRGPERGESRASVLRIPVDWTWRGEAFVLAARSTVSLGLDLASPTLHSTHEPGSGIPDARFAAWLGQVQWVRRLELLRGSQLVVRGDVQLSRDPLLSMERFALGGLSSVRGFRTNRLVRDNGMVGSVELRIPVLRDAHGRDLLQVAPFVDAGRGWNESGDTSRRTLASAGLGLRLRLGRRGWLRAYWGGRLRELPRPGSDPQDHGFHVEAGVGVF